MHLVITVQRDEDVLVHGSRGAQRRHLPAHGQGAIQHAQDTRARLVRILLGIQLTAPDDAVARGGRGDDRLRRRGLDGGDEHGAVLDDAGLVGGDLLDGVAQPGGMVQADGCDHLDILGHDIGAVPGSAHADLDDGDVDRMIGEDGQGHDGQDLEEAHARPARRGRALIHHPDVGGHVLPRGDEPLLADRLAVQGDALANGGQVGAGEAAGAHAGGGQEALGHAGGGGLAVGAGDVDVAVGPLGVAEQVEGPFDALQTRLDAVLGGARQDLGLHLAHAARDLDGAGGGEQVGPVAPGLFSFLALALRVGARCGGRVGKLGLPLVPVVGLVLIDLGQEGVEALQVAARNHVGGDELAQGLQVLLLRPALGGVTTTAGLVGFVGFTVLGVSGLQVGQELGVNAITTSMTIMTSMTSRAIGAGRAAGGQDGIDDLLARGPLGDAEGRPRMIIPYAGTRLTPAHHHVLRDCSSNVRPHAFRHMRDQAARADATAICHRGRQSNRVHLS